jgi:hypothetical protein
MKMKNKCTQSVTILQTYQLGAMQKEFTLLGKFDVHTMHCITKDPTLNLS